MHPSLTSPSGEPISLKQVESYRKEWTESNDYRVEDDVVTSNIKNLKDAFATEVEDSKTIFGSDTLSKDDMEILEKKLEFDIKKAESRASIRSLQEYINKQGGGTVAPRKSSSGKGKQSVSKGGVTYDYKETK